MIEHQVNAAIQVLPTPGDSTHPYVIVDKAIEAIASTGLPYKVCPFETVVEGTYDEVMDAIRLAQEACYLAGAESVITNVKIQTSAKEDVTIESKIGKYETNAD